MRPGAEPSPASEAATTAPTTARTPPSISWPTTPFTLPADYGQVSLGTRPEAPPRETYPADAVLPSMVWVVDESLTVRFEPPEDFRQDPWPLPPVTDFDRDNAGLYLVERWRVIDQPSFAGLSIQANPGESSPLLSRQEFSDSIATDDLTWYLWNGATVRQTGASPNFGLAVVGDYLFMVNGTPSAMSAIIEALSIDR